MDMGFSETRFYKSTFNFKRCANCSMESVPMYTYESFHKLYDVIEIDGYTTYRVNGGISTCLSYHTAIMKRYGIERKDAK